MRQKKAFVAITHIRQSSLTFTTSISFLRLLTSTVKIIDLLYHRRKSFARTSWHNAIRNIQPCYSITINSLFGDGRRTMEMCFRSQQLRTN